MSFIMKENKPFDPLQIRFFRAQRQTMEPHHLPTLLHEFELGIGHQSFQWPTCRAIASRRRMQPFPGGMVEIHQPKNGLDNRVLQALNYENH
jgi:hypothetical protein